MVNLQNQLIMCIEVWITDNERDLFSGRSIPSGIMKYQCVVNFSPEAAVHRCSIK